MRDMPTLARVAIVAALLISLMLLMRQCGSDQERVPSGGEGQTRGRETVKNGAPELRFYPALPATVPDLNDGYIFNEERQLEVSDFDDPSLGRGGIDTVDMEAVVYSGSIITGDLRKALIAYQEKAPVQRRVARAARSIKRQKAVKSSYKHKQLLTGQVFMGYKVAIIEADRLVFEKDGEKIEKFLFDAGKERVVIKSSSAVPQPATTAPRGMVRAVVPTQARPAPKPPQTVVSGALRKIPQPKPPLQNGRVRRSQQRLLGLDPSFVAPQPPGGAK